MKILQFYSKQDPQRKPRIGVLEGESTVVALNVEGMIRDMIGLIDIESLRDSSAAYSLEKVKLLPAILNPDKIICIGLNYYDHVIESGAQVPKVPMLFPKYNNAAMMTKSSSRVKCMNVIMRLNWL